MAECQAPTDLTFCFISVSSYLCIKLFKFYQNGDPRFCHCPLSAACEQQLVLDQAGGHWRSHRPGHCPLSAELPQSKPSRAGHTRGVRENISSSPAPAAAWDPCPVQPGSPLFWEMGSLSPVPSAGSPPRAGLCLHNPPGSA